MHEKKENIVPDSISTIIQRKLLSEQFDDIEKFKYLKKYTDSTYDVEEHLNDLREYNISFEGLLSSNNYYRERRQKYIEDKLLLEEEFQTGIVQDKNGGYLMTMLQAKAEEKNKV